MKIRAFCTILIIVMMTGIYAQIPSITLTFTADHNGQHIPMDSILIENLTQGGDTTLYAPDTVLVLDYVTGIGDVETIGGHDFTVSQNYPNPMEGRTTVSLYLPENEDVSITVCAIMGSELIHLEYHLDRGNHHFIFFSGKESLYFLTVQTDHQKRTIKVINSPSQTFNSGICKLEYNGQQTGMNEYKTGNTMNNFIFDLGDQLKFISFTSLGEQIIISYPTSDETYYFHYTGDPCTGTPTITDINGNTYNTAQIGNQCWMKENLKTTTYRNGAPIPNVPDDIDWSYLTTSAYVWYNNDIAWKDKYGALYNSFATVDTNGLCPTGWHVPTNDEWTDLTDYIGGISPPHGNELKSCRQVNSPLGEGCNTSEHPRWEEDNNYGNYGTDDYGFSGLPGGVRYGYGPFDAIGYYGGWWPTPELLTGIPWYRSLSYMAGDVDVSTNSERNGYSVRCIRD